MQNMKGCNVQWHNTVLPVDDDGGIVGGDSGAASRPDQRESLMAL